MEHIILSDLNPEIKEFLAMPAGVKKNYAFTQLKSNHPFKQDILYKDGCMYYGFSTYTVSRSRNGFFLKPQSRHGFTLNEKGKVTFWFGSNVKKLPGIMTVLKHLGHDWFEEKYAIFLTKGLFEKLLTNKITNPLGFFEAWLKAQRIKASPRLVYKAIHEHNSTQLYSMMLKYSTVIEHMDQFLIRYAGKDYDTVCSGDFIDLLDQAIILERKIDPKWSKRRIEEEHQKATREIMDLKLDSLDDRPIPELQEIKKLVESPYITLLDTERDVYMEGKIMNHCIYTNYWSRIQSLSMLCFNVDFHGQTGTLTIWPDSYGTDTYRIYDFRSKRNQEPGQDAKAHVERWLEQFNQRVTENNAFVSQKSHYVTMADNPGFWEEAREPLPF